ncbi:chromosome segregation protein SMC [Fusobacterium russii]|uniref:chromosome segregation protein SMC n=1 Tax=Fusobacterium russii TaxID=854 RepID=UPI0003A668E5|nr:chromosome segregation protein SMC [Fusobacterium russii]
MYLKAVEIDGFKSFGEKVYIDFNRGITSIVGPNGSGKSNILDAVLWVLGEQSYKNIRAKESQDVIFSGGKEKKAMNKAEVSLYIDNEDRYLDIDNDTVKITRKINISGENEYLINDIKSRLKDIGSLFLDTGIGKTAYSVIGQGKVERIINSSPKEVKGIIEEAAGIKKLQANKIESVKNLSNIENELDKVEIILNETRENKNKIEKQAELAQKFLNLREEKNSLAKGIYLTELIIKEKQYLENEKQKEELTVSCNQIKEKFEKTKNRLDFIELEKEEVRKEIVLISSRNKELRDQISEKEKEKAITSERIENFKKEKTSREETRNNINSKLEVKKQEIEDTILTQSALKKNILEMENENREFEKNISGLEDEKRKTEILIESKNKKRRDLELQKLNVVNDIEITNKRIASSESEIGNYRQELELLNKKFSEASENKKNTEKLLENKEKELVDIEERNEFLETQLSEISIKINRVSEQMRNLEYDEKRYSAKLEALVRMEENNEGFNKGVKEVLNSGIEGIEGVFISLISFESKFEKAIEAAIPGNLQDIIVRDKEVAKKAINYLTEKKVGRASFLALDLIKPNKREFKQNISGVLGIAADLVKIDSKYKKVVDFVLGNLLVVENIDIAINIINNGLFSGNVVTLSGELMSSRGRITGGENQKSGISQIFERKKEIKDLEENLLAIRQKIKTGDQEREKLNKKLEDYENEIDQIDAKEEACRKQVNIFKEEFTTIKDRLEKLEREIIIIKTNIEDEEKYAKEFFNKIDTSKDEKEKIENLISLLNKEIEDDTKLFEKYNVEMTELNKKFADIRILYLNNKDKIEQLSEAIQRLKREEEEFLHERNNLGEKISNIETEISDLISLENTLLTEIEDLSKTYNTENKDIERLSNREISLNDEEKTLMKEKSELDSKFLHENDKLEKLKDSLERIKIDVDSINEILTTLENVIAQEVSSDKIKSAKENLKSLEAKLSNFGDVNLLAIEEFKELKARYNFISTQRDDIVKAKKTLLDLIEEIDEKIHDEFYKTYSEINDNFNKMCEDTIRNTEGRLNIINQEDFENCGIEIFVKFKNKKKQPLSLLSGGEKSMVAIAFIMAIFMYKPSPFTFLDEIEAALDEKNTKNLLNKLREFTDKSQFILITHNKDTMKESDSIFGVTMNKEIGISKIVPVKF